MGGHKNELTNIKHYALLQGAKNRKRAGPKFNEELLKMYHQRQLTMQRPDTTNAKSCKKRARSLPPDALTNSMILIVAMKNNKQRKMLLL